MKSRNLSIGNCFDGKIPLIIPLRLKKSRLNRKLEPRSSEALWLLGFGDYNVKKSASAYKIKKIIKISGLFAFQVCEAVLCGKGLDSCHFFYCKEKNGIV